MLLGSTSSQAVFWMSRDDMHIHCNIYTYINIMSSIIYILYHYEYSIIYLYIYTYH